MAEDLNKNLNENALNDDDLEQVTGGKYRKGTDKGGKNMKARARVGLGSRLDAEGGAESYFQR